MNTSISETSSQSKAPRRRRAGIVVSAVPISMLVGGASVAGASAASAAPQSPTQQSAQSAKGAHNVHHHRGTHTMHHHKGAHKANQKKGAHKPHGCGPTQISTRFKTNSKCLEFTVADDAPNA